MKKPLKIIKYSLITILLIGSFIVLGIFGFVKLIAMQRSCAWANIDNIEIHGHIDIPEVISSNCNYFAEENIKIVSFQIDTARVNMEAYLKINALKKLDLTSIVDFDERVLILSDFKTLKNSSEFYYRIGSKEDKLWQILLNQTTGQLCVFIQY